MITSTPFHTHLAPGPDGSKPRIVVAGGGIAALEAVLGLRALAGLRVAIELIAPEAELRYPPLDVVEPFDLPAPRVPLATLLAGLQVERRVDAIDRVDIEQRRVHTRGGATVRYDVLVVAVGARPLPSLPGTLTFDGVAGRDAFRDLLAGAQAGEHRDLLFAVPAGVTWPLPLYELAVLTARQLRAHGSAPVRVAIASPEQAPLACFGSRAGALLLDHLDAQGIVFQAGCVVDRIAPGEAHLAPDDERVPADRVVTIPALHGPAIAGLPCDPDGFLPTDGYGLVKGADDVYACGDGASSEVKQGGIAAQQADVVAETIAARAGAPVSPAPLHPVLRGMLLTGERPRYLEADVAGRTMPTVSSEPLWWPPLKVAARFLGPALGTRLSVPAAAATPPATWAEGSKPAELEVGA